MSGKNGQKSGEKSGEPKPGELVAQPHGGAIQYGSEKGSAPGTGRPPNEFKRRMREIASSDDALEYLEECVRGEHGAKAAISAHKHISDRGYGKAPQTVKVEDDRTDDGYDSDRLWRAVKRLHEIADLEKMLASGEVIEAEIVEEDDGDG